jgi:hypothetical protein
MKKPLLAVAVLALVLGLCMSLLADVRAAEGQILAGVAKNAPQREMAAQFEQTSSHNPVVRFGTAPALINLVTVSGASPAQRAPG